MATATKSPSDVLKLAKDEKIQIVDVKFADLPGTWQHFSIPVEDLDESPFTEGLGFDGSSIRGFQKIQESDMMLVADPTTAVIDPACKIPTLSLICSVVDPISRQPYSRDPRYIAQKAERYLKETGIADTSYWGPEAEFFLFNDVRYDSSASASYYFIDSDEAAWNTGEGDGKNGGSNLGHKIRHKEGYFPVPPQDSLQDIRSEMVIEMRKAGVMAEMHHHEVATAGQCEIDMRFAPLVKMADNLMWYKYIIKNIARKYGLAATFMPKPLRRQRLGHARPPEPLEGREAAVLRRERLCRIERDRPPLRRRHPPPRPGAAGPLRPHDQLLSPAGARLRSPGEPGVLPAEPLGRRAGADVLQERQDQADRVPLPRPELQPLPGLLGHAARWPGRHQEPDRAAGGDR